MARSPIDCGRVRRKTVKLTSPTEATSAGTERGAAGTDNGNANKSRIKMEQIASSENKGDARNEANGRRRGRGRHREGERKISAEAHLAPLPHSVHVHFIWRPAWRCVSSGSKHCEALCDFGCHLSRASMPAPIALPSLPPTSHLPSFRPRVISADNLGGAFVLRTGNFWLVGVGLARSLAPLRRGRTERRTVPAFVPPWPRLWYLIATDGAGAISQPYMLFRIAG